jgi:hypothetical protein
VPHESLEIGPARPGLARPCPSKLLTTETSAARHSRVDRSLNEATAVRSCVGSNLVRAKQKIAKNNAVATPATRASAPKQQKPMTSSPSQAMAY